MVAIGSSDTNTRTDGWLEVFTHPHKEPVYEAAFVLTAVSIEHEILQEARRWQLWVPVKQADRAYQELHSYWLENQTVAKRPPQSPAVDSGLLGVLGFLLVLWALPWLQNTVPGSWHEDGAMAASSVVQGQWWRCVTALTLHADLGHIASNCAFGALFGGLLGRQLGSGLAWLFTLLAAAVANGINAWVQPASFVSIGASTATFAAMGLLAVVVWRRGFYRNLDWRRSVAPLFAAIALFSFTGVGGVRTDVFAHLFGALSGGAFGLVAARVPTRWLRRNAQYSAAAATVGLVVLCWLFARSQGV